MKVLDTRRKIFTALETYTTAKVPRDPNRVGDLTFFILSPLQVPLLNMNCLATLLTTSLDLSR